MQSRRQPARLAETATEMLVRPLYIISNAYPKHVGQYQSDKSSQLSLELSSMLSFLHRRKCLSKSATAAGWWLSGRASFFCP